jgi:hypothetical protein
VAATSTSSVYRVEPWKTAAALPIRMNDGRKRSGRRRVAERKHSRRAAFIEGVMSLENDMLEKTGEEGFDSSRAKGRQWKC